MKAAAKSNQQARRHDRSFHLPSAPLFSPALFHHITDVMDNTSFRIACVGAGFFAQLHHAAWIAANGAQLVGIADPGKDAKVPDGVPLFDSLEAMLAAEPVDILDIATPPQTHAGLIKAAIEGGVNRIICQKPFCGTLEAAQQMTELAASSGVSLAVHENFRFQPWYRQLHNLVTEERLGRLYQFRFALRPGDGQGPAAYLDRQPYFQTMERFLVHETAVHFLDVFSFLFGRPDHIYADLRRLNPAIAGEDAGMIICGYADGFRAVFDGNRLADHAADNTRLTMGEALLEGERGSLRIDGFGRISLRDQGAADWQEIVAPPADKSFGGGCVAALCQQAVDGWRSGNTPEVMAEDYLNVLMMEEAAYQSAATGSRVIFGAAWPV